MSTTTLAAPQPPPSKRQNPSPKARAVPARASCGGGSPRRDRRPLAAGQQHRRCSPSASSPRPSRSRSTVRRARRRTAPSAPRPWSRSSGSASASPSAPPSASSLAVAAGLSRLGEDAIDPPMQMLRTLPHFGLIPLFIIWFGIGETPEDRADRDGRRVPALPQHLRRHPRHRPQDARGRRVDAPDLVASGSGTW